MEDEEEKTKRENVYDHSLFPSLKKVLKEHDHL